MLTIGTNRFLKFFARVKNNKRLKAPRMRTIENRAKMLKTDWFKNDITHVLIKMVSPLGRVGISFFSSCCHSVYNWISYNKYECFENNKKLDITQRKNKEMMSAISLLVRIWKICHSYPGCSLI